MNMDQEGVMKLMKSYFMMQCVMYFHHIQRRLSFGTYSDGVYSLNNHKLQMSTTASIALDDCYESDSDGNTHSRTK